MVQNTNAGISFVKSKFWLGRGGGEWGQWRKGGKMRLRKGKLDLLRPFKGNSIKWAFNNIDNCQITMLCAWNWHNIVYYQLCFNKKMNVVNEDWAFKS